MGYWKYQIYNRLITTIVWKVVWFLFYFVSTSFHANIAEEDEFLLL